MDKLGMREWVAALEEVLDKKLKKWRKEPHIENGEAVQLAWQFEQTHFHVNIFWEDRRETVKLQYLSPRGDQSFLWHDLNDKTLSRIMDRVGNLAQITMHPVIDPQLD